MTAPRSIVLIHGAWHAAWSWAALQHELDRRGLASFAIDLPGRGTSTLEPSGLIGDGLHVEAVLRRLGEDVVLVGHSYGGAVLSEVAGRTPALAHAVYIGAFALACGESVNGFLRSAPRHRAGIADHMQPRDDGSIALNLATVGSIYDGVPALERAAHVARLTPQPPDTFTDQVTGDPFGRVPTTYVLLERDDAVHPVHQESFAQRCDHVVRLDTGHFPMIHSPALIAEILEPIARADESVSERWRQG
jgi:pimeloyl-ACP methyl ester carboxylesterase